MERNETTPPSSTKSLEAGEENELLIDQNIRLSHRSTSTPTAANPSQRIISPEMIRPFSKAGPRQNTKRNNRKMSSAIVTDSPERKKIEEK
ncbi:unnamed protein product [Acanthoscelides obtectus]|uniref:Uncharacterized protein n=1 Tax=Acanthoscelides obtectus TaxID=200917 RepID=A0A9P0JS71_ACAOB|nr:unnamed protein product [Acanthoscelides obtectus]CAK1679241.1 hypothetical protein AOBTE_LOCUS32184 [Acanthoscelides obtectus]